MSTKAIPIVVARDQDVDLLEDSRGGQRLPWDGLHGHQGAERDEIPR